MRLWPSKRNGNSSEDVSRLADSIWSAPRTGDVAAGTHPPAWRCVYCHQARPPYVYSGDGTAYCVSCAHALEEMGMPIGGEQRSDDARELPSMGDR